MAFKDDVEIGKVFEYHVASHLEERGLTGIIVSPDDVKCAWDIKGTYNGNEFTFECKNDRMACATGNIFIECSSSGVTSGLFGNRVDYIVYRICNSSYIIGYNALLTLLSDAIISNTAKRVKANDAKNTGYLLPYKDILSQFKPLSNDFTAN